MFILWVKITTASTDLSISGQVRIFRSRTWRKKSVCRSAPIARSSSGERDLKASELAIILDHCGVDANWFLFGTGQKERKR